MCFHVDCTPEARGSRSRPVWLETAEYRSMASACLRSNTTFLYCKLSCRTTKCKLPPNALFNVLVDNSNENYTMQIHPVNIYNLRRVTKTIETIDSCQARWASHGIKAVGMRYFLVWIQCGYNWLLTIALHLGYLCAFKNSTNNCIFFATFTRIPG